MRQFGVMVKDKDGDVMATYYIVRHGETLANRGGILQGHLDVSLSELGKHQADLAGKALSKYRMDAIYSSDLDRTKETAKSIAKYQTCQLILDPRLREIHCGDMEGKTMRESRQLYPEFFLAFEKDALNAIRPGGGESIQNLYDRVSQAFKDIVNAHRDPSSNVVIVSHGGAIRCLLAYAAGIKVDPQSPAARNTSISTVSQAGDKLIVDVFDDVAHLSDPRSS